MTLDNGQKVLKNNIEVSYYDGLPTSQEELFQDVDEDFGEEGDDNVL